MKYQFKTNINCGGCIAKIAPHLNGNHNINRWNVDTANPAKILTVETDGLNETEVATIITQAGFNATSLNNN